LPCCRFRYANSERVAGVALSSTIRTGVGAPVGPEEEVAAAATGVRAPAATATAAPRRMTVRRFRGELGMYVSL
jgi:hypothetical protein